MHKRYAQVHWLFSAILFFPVLGFCGEKWEPVNFYNIPLYKYICDKNIPGYKEKTANIYMHFSKANIKIAEGIEKEIQRLENDRFSGGSSGYVSDKEGLIEVCEELSLAYETYSHPPDTRRSTSQGTWDLYIASLKKGDKTTVLSCLIGDAKRKWKEAFRDMSKQQIQDLSDLIKDFQMAYELSEDMQVGFAVRHDGIGSEVYFTKERDEWKISQM
jgi:hypothetical protein